MSDVLHWTVQALVAPVKVPDIQGLPTIVHKKK